jgi:thioredoxin reductase
MSITQEQVVVVGAGVAGCTAALEAAKRGLKVTLVDEHPQNTTSMSLDAPYFYGARLVSVLSDEGTIADRVLGSNDLLMDCLEAGVEVLTNTCAWGVFVPGTNNIHLGCKQIGFADAEKSWMASFDYLVVAGGARDLVLSFPGWDLPGVLAVKGATTLLGKYQALGGNTVLVLGSGNAALQLAQQAIEAGITVAGVVEADLKVQGDSALYENLKAQNVPFYLGHTIERVSGVNEVSGARLVAVSDEKAVIEIPCDTVCMAYNVIPNIELPAVAGCALDFDEKRNGWSPRLTDDMETTVPGIFVVGDAAGVTESALIDPEFAVFQAKVAATAIAKREGLEVGSDEFSSPTSVSTSVASYPPNLWLDSLVSAGGMNVMACQCEDVSRQEIVEVRAPKYLTSDRGSPAGAVDTLVVNGVASQDMHKRMTRVGMGHCQGRRCREHATMLLARAAGISLSCVAPGSYRVPVRPLPVSVLQAHDEPASMGERWPMWLHPVDDTLPHTH